jgi:hypothetical protein
LLALCGLDATGIQASIQQRFADILKPALQRQPIATE